MHISTHQMGVIGTTYPIMHLGLARGSKGSTLKYSRPIINSSSSQDSAWGLWTSPCVCVVCLHLCWASRATVAQKWRDHVLFSFHSFQHTELWCLRQLWSALSIIFGRNLVHFVSCTLTIFFTNLHNLETFHSKSDSHSDQADSRTPQLRKMKGGQIKRKAPIWPDSRDAESKVLKWNMNLRKNMSVEPNKEQIYWQRNIKSWIGRSPPPFPHRLCNEHSSFAHISRSNDVNSWITLMRCGL